VLLAVVALGGGGAVVPARPAASQEGVVQLGIRFVPVDVYVDAGSKHLGAYQVEVESKDATIVGLEGGESKAFNQAPFYDPAALQGKKIIVAAFSTEEDLPTGLTRVARLHLAVTNGELKDGMPNLSDKLVVATDGDGNTVNAKLTLKPMTGEIK